MEITLEKIELVKDRTGVTYKEAKDALEKSAGNVVDAIISIEETIDRQIAPKKIGKSGEALFDKVNEIVQRGNVTRIKVTHEDTVILNLPINAGIVGIILAPWGTLAGIIAAFGFSCRIEIVRSDGSVIDVSDKAGEVYEDAKTKGTRIYDEFKEKAPGVYETVKETTDKAMSRARDAAEKIKGRKETPEVEDLAEDFDKEWFSDGGDYRDPEDGNKDDKDNKKDDKDNKEADNADKKEDKDNKEE
jgi:hypothetical protein